MSLSHMAFAVIALLTCHFWQAGGVSRPGLWIDAESAATFVIEELRELSDSGIYKTLSLLNITSSSVKVGLYHHVVELNLDLASPYFDSGLPSEMLEVLVFQDREDGALSFSLDRFPSMRQADIEKFTDANNARRRRFREEIFTKWAEDEDMNRSTMEQSQELTKRTIKIEVGPPQIYPKDEL